MFYVRARDKTFSWHNIERKTSLLSGYTLLKLADNITQASL